MVAFTSVCFRVCDTSPVHVAGKKATGRVKNAAEAGWIVVTHNELPGA